MGLHRAFMAVQPASCSHLFRSKFLVMSIVISWVRSDDEKEVLNSDEYIANGIVIASPKVRVGSLI